MEDPVEYEVPPDVLQELENQLTDEMLIRLTAYADQKHKRLYWQGIRGGEMPEGNEPKDIVQNAVKKILIGKRKWNPSKHPDLFEYLTRSVIDSDINHAAIGWANRHLRTDSALTAKTETEDNRSFFDLQECPNGNPETQLAAKAEAEESDRFLWGLLEDLENDTLLKGIVECIVDGVTKPKEISEKLGTNTKEINNAKKRLKRRIEEFWAARNPS